MSQFFFNFLSNELPDNFKDKVHRGVFAESESSGKIKKLVDEFKDLAGRGLIAPDLEEILTVGIKRFTLLLDYRLKKKSKFGNTLKEKIGKKWAKKRGKLHVIKAFRFEKFEDVDEHANRARDAYLLPEEKVFLN